jgi:hypothetical protein
MFDTHAIVNGKQVDLNIWRPLPDATLDGFTWTPLVKRWYRCDLGFKVELAYAHPSIKGCYHPSAIFADDLYFTPDWIKVDKLTPIS